jgi:restriction system protein
MIDMPIPSYEKMMLPVLKTLGDKKEHRLSEVIENIIKEFKLTEKDQKELLPSGTEPILGNRVRWARLYLDKAGLLESTQRGAYKITEKGLRVLKEKPSEINVAYLKQFPDFMEFKEPKEGKNDTVEKKSDDSLNPMEMLESSYQRIKNELAADLMQEIKKATANFFENTIVELVVKMGYGGSRKDAGQAIGKSGDEGIDGIIKEDRLGLDAIYLQAKKWEGTVGRPEIHKFVGALKGQAANKGIFITTSTFSKEAMEYAARIDSPKIVLIDGKKLAELMIEHNVGVSEVTNYEIKKIDLDYFAEA